MHVRCLDLLRGGGARDAQVLVVVVGGEVAHGRGVNRGRGDGRTRWCVPPGDGVETE